MYRRKFLRPTAALAVTATTFRLRPDALWADEPSQRSVMTVTGLVDAEELGPTLPHEHVMVDFIGAEKVSQDRYDRGEVVQVSSR